MKYEDAKRRLVRITKSDKGNIQAKANICNSMINQVRLREGERAARELTRDVSGR